MPQLESLANELFFDIFEFLSTAHVIHGFLGLNSRLNYLLYTHFQTHKFNLQSIAKVDVDIICQQNLSIFIDNITSLHLSNDFETPNLCEFLLSHGFTFNRFINLKSLSLYHIDSSDTINEILIQCRHLSYLTHLKLINYYTNRIYKTADNMFDNIWSFPKLTHCIFNDITIEGSWFYNLSAVSSSIKFLSIKKIVGDIGILHHLFKLTPHLQRLDMNYTNWAHYDGSDLIFSPLLSLKASFIYDGDAMIDFLKRSPNLSYLTLKISNICINGYDWEKLLVNYLPKIKIFRLKMTFDFSADENIHRRIDKLVDSFRSRFWLEEHQWYVRCDYYSTTKCKIGVLYTLPYAFNTWSCINIDYSKSTKPDENDFYSHKNVHIVNQENIEINSFNDLSLFRNRFPNIRHFEITLPLIDSFHSSMNFPFNQLIYLTVKLNAILGYQHLQIILDRAHQLYTLKFCSFGGSIVELFQLTSSSVRELDLIVAQVNHGAFFNNENCINLINSPLGRQCEVLRIELENSTDIFDLIEKMPLLRVLIFRCKDIVCNSLKFPSVQEDFMRWLQQNLSPKSSIITDSSKGATIRVWIYRKTNDYSPISNGINTSRYQLPTSRYHLSTSLRRLFSINLDKYLCGKIQYTTSE